jgi:hypothetical protein
MFYSHFYQRCSNSWDFWWTTGPAPWQREHNIWIGYGSELIWQWKIDLSCPFTIHKHEINFSFRLIAVLFSNEKVTSGANQMKSKPFCWKISVRHQVHRWLTNSRTLLKSALSVRRFWTSLFYRNPFSKQQINDVNIYSINTCDMTYIYKTNKNILYNILLQGMPNSYI